MSDYAADLLRQLQQRLAEDVQRARTYEERSRLTAYWYDLEALITAESGTIEE